MAAEASVPNPDWRLVVRLTARGDWVENNPDLLSLRATALSKIGRDKNHAQFCEHVSLRSSDKLRMAPTVASVSSRFNLSLTLV